MPLELSPVTKLHSNLPPCKIQVRIARIWSYHKQFKPTDITGVDLLLVDEKGDRIQASIRAHLVSKFQKQLQEGECYMIMNFEILDNCGSYRATSHPNKINFMFMTCVKKSEQLSNLVSRFNFISFPEIQNQSNNDNVLIDVIGEIIGMNELKDVNISGCQTKLLNLQLKDLGESIINITLWEKWVEDVNSYVKCYKNGLIILVGSLMKTKPYNGNISVQNSSFSTKLFINSPIAEMTKFKESMVKSKHESSSIITINTPPSFRKNSKASFSLADKRTVEQIAEMNEGATCNVVALLFAIATEDPWFYIVCTVCFKKVSPFFNLDTEEIEANKFSCDKCNTSITTTRTRYKLKVKVVDDTSTASLILFDQEVMKLIHKSAYELLEQQV